MHRFSTAGVALAACAVALFAAQPARAATRTTSISVSVEVVSSCNVTPSGMFGAGCTNTTRETSYCVVKHEADADIVSVANCQPTSGTDRAIAESVEQGAQVTTIVY